MHVCANDKLIDANALKNVQASRMLPWVGATVSVLGDCIACHAKSGRPEHQAKGRTSR